MKMLVSGLTVQVSTQNRMFPAVSVSVCVSSISNVLTRTETDSFDVDALTGKSTYRPVHKQSNLHERPVIYLCKHL